MDVDVGVGVGVAVGEGGGVGVDEGVDKVNEQERARSSTAKHEPHRCSETVGLVVAKHDPERARERCGTGAGDQHPAPQGLRAQC